MANGAQAGDSLTFDPFRVIGPAIGTDTSATDNVTLGQNESFQDLSIRSQYDKTITLNAALVLNGVWTMENGTIAKGTVAGVTVNAAGSFSWNAGELKNLLVNLGAAVGDTPNTSIIGVSTVHSLNGTTFNNYGTVSWTGGDINLVNANTSIVNLNTFDIKVDNKGINGDGAANQAFKNLSPVDPQNPGRALKKSTGAGNTTIGVPFTNSGTFLLQSGTVTLTTQNPEQSGNQNPVTELNGGSLTVTGLTYGVGNGFFRGVGTYTGTINNDATIHPGLSGAPGVLNIVGGDLTLDGTSKIVIDSDASGTIGVLNVQASGGTGGVISLNGEVDIIRNANWKPKTGTKTFLTYVSIAPNVRVDFVTKNGGGSWTADDGNRYHFNFSKNDTHYDIVVAPGLLAAGTPAGSGQTIADGDLAPIMQEAVARWTAVLGSDPGLSSVQVQISNLSDGLLAYALPGDIVLDASAAGFGWFIDPTPADDAEFATATGPGEFQAASDSPAYGAIDLLTVLMHEYGHELGLGHSTDPQDVMAPTLAASLRRVPTASTLVTAVIQGDGSGPDGLHVGPAGAMPLVIPGDMFDGFGFSRMLGRQSAEVQEPFGRLPVLTGIPLFDRHVSPQLVELSGGSSENDGDAAETLDDYFADIYEPRFEYSAVRV